MNQNQEHNESDFQKFIKQHSHISDNWPDWEKMRLEKSMNYIKEFNWVRVVMNNPTILGAVTPMKMSKT